MLSLLSCRLPAARLTSRWQTVYQFALLADIATALRSATEQDLLAILNAVALHPTEADLRTRFGW